MFFKHWQRRKATSTEIIFFIHKRHCMASKTVTFGTAVSGTAKPTALDSAGNNQPNSGFKKGSVKFSSSDPAIFTVLQDTTIEENFTITQVAPGTANVLCNAEDITGTPLPQGSVSLTLTQQAATGIEVDFN
jgi:hypothetical protein